MKNIVLSIYLILLVFCKNQVPAPQFSQPDILNFMIEELLKSGFEKDTGNFSVKKKIRELSFPGDSVSTGNYTLWRKKNFCKLSFCDFSYDSTNMDSINARHIISSHFGMPIGMPNKVLTYLGCLPPHYIVHLDSIKYNDYLLIYKISAPGFDSVFINELSSIIKTSMQATDCRQISLVVAKLKKI